MGKLDVSILMAVFLVSAILGDAVNYLIGQTLGTWAVQRGLVKQEYIKRTGTSRWRHGGGEGGSRGRGRLRHAIVVCS
jgi:membrane-associated protein